MLSNILEHHGRANQCLASLEEDLAHAKLEEEKLKATIEAVEKEKSEMNARVAVMERKDRLRFVGSQDGRLSDSQPSRNDWRFQKPQPHHHQKMGGDPTLNLEEFEKCPQTIRRDIVNNNGERRFALLEVNKALKVWRADNVIAGVSFVKGNRTFKDEWTSSLVFQDLTTPNDAQANLDFEEDLRTNERVRLRAEVRHLEAESQRLTRSTRVRLEYELNNPP
ncbi:hypothetical protein R1flu_020533 [Riccia fluitans]|uniref:Uncharacterized protein n=1 Tax=Riccia fluitans TaxID=41844 RepID=A0ABD1ZM49_9MARC